MNGPGERCHVFESLWFDAATHELCRPGHTVRLRPQTSLVLALLLSRRGEVVTREEIRQALWPDSRVVLFEGSIAAVIRELRRALGDNPKAPRFIETIPKRGYRFLSPSTAPLETGLSASRKQNVRPRPRGFARLLPGLALAGLMVLPGGDEQPGPSHLPGPDPVTVAVFPFENLIRQPAHTLLAQTVSRDLVGWLGPAAPNALRVVDGTDDRKDLPPADFVLHGSVREDADALVISARLLTGADSGFVWGEDYRRKTDDTNLASREVAARIAERVLAAAMPRAPGNPGAAALSDAAATAYRHGIEALELQSPEGTAQAVAGFEQAVRLAPGSADAHARLAQALIRWPGVPITPERAERSRRMAERAIQLDAGSSVAHRVLGEIHLYFDRDWSLAGRRLERGVELSPADASAHHAYATWLAARGRAGEALREIDLAEALDPASVLISIDAMLINFYARDFEATVAAARRLRQLWPESSSSHRYIVLSRLATGDIAGAAAEARTGLEHFDPDGDAQALSDSEVLDAYWAATFRLLSRYVREQSGDPSALALVLVQMGRLDEAVAALQQAMSTPRFSYFLPYLGVSPVFDVLCGDPEFERILRTLSQSAVSRELSRCESAIRASTQTW